MNLVGRQRAHAEAVANAHLSADVEAVLEEMLIDLEVWDSENRWRRHQRQLAAQAVEIELLHSKVSELEAQRVEAERHTLSRGVAAAQLKERFCAELWTLSKSLKSIHALERKLERGEEALAKVPKLERDLDNALRSAAQAHAAATAIAASFPEGGSVLSSYEGGGGRGSSGSSSDSGGFAPSKSPRVTEAPKELAQWLQRALGGKKHRKAANAYALALCQSLGANPHLTVDAVVRLNLSELRERGGMTGSHALLVSAMPPAGAPLFAFAAPFMCLEDKVLLRTFSYLKAWSVLATAQVCRPFFTRVDALFGMGSTLNDHGPTPPLHPTFLPQAIHAAPALLPPPYPAPGAAPSPDFAIGVPDAQASSQAAEVASSKGTLRSAVGASVMGGLAKKVASKLSSVEMKGIVQMTERIKRLESSLGHAVEVKDDLEARLTSAESVKEFLVEKLKDTELVLKKTIDGANEAARQHHADQEVINFLDGRVVELEKQITQHLTSTQAAQAAEAQRQQQQEQRAHGLQEMLEWQQDQAAAAQAEAKAHKKLLVREVKTLRQKLAAALQGRGAYQQQANVTMAHN